MNQPNFYSILVPGVRYSLDLTWFDKVMYSEITALTQAIGFCFAYNKYFETVFGVSTSTVTRSIKRLEKFGFIKSELEKDEKTQAIIRRKIYITPMVKNDYTPIVKNDQSRARNLAFKNNIINSNINSKYSGKNFNKNQKTDVNVPWLEKYL